MLEELMKELKPSTIDWGQKCWRYFTVDRFIDALENGHIYFAAASEFEDKFEGATCIVDPKNLGIANKIPFFDMTNKAFKQLQGLTKINCWHKSDYESDLMWKIYAQNKKGVAITTTPKKMQQAFKTYKIKDEYGEEDLYIGNVEYIDLSSQHIEDTMLGIFFYKHIVFASEKELRLSISLRMADEFGVIVPQSGIFVSVDYSILIENIIIGPSISKEDRDRLIKVIKKLGYQTKVLDSCLTYNPIFV
jgi:hypothetical protein